MTKQLILVLVVVALLLGALAVLAPGISRVQAARQLRKLDPEYAAYLERCVGLAEGDLSLCIERAASAYVQTSQGQFYRQAGDAVEVLSRAGGNYIQAKAWEQWIANARALLDLGVGALPCVGALVAALILGAAAKGLGVF